VAEEDNFLFSYNITARAYTDRVKSILLACDQDEVINALVADLQNYERGTQHDETQWLDVGLHACQQLNARRKVIFLAAYELAYAADFVQRAGNDGYEIIVVPETIRRKLPGLRDALGNPIRDLDRYRDEWQDSFRFTFIDPSDLSGAERAVWETLPQIFAARGGISRHVTQVLVSETMRLMEGRYQEAVGVLSSSSNSPQNSAASSPVTSPTSEQYLQLSVPVYYYCPDVCISSPSISYTRVNSAEIHRAWPPEGTGHSSTGPQNHCASKTTKVLSAELMEPLAPGQPCCRPPGRPYWHLLQQLGGPRAARTVSSRPDTCSDRNTTARSDLHDRPVDTEVLVHREVAERSDLAPGHFWVPVSQGIRERACDLTQQKQPVEDRVS
jgi:hypothetical protein